MSVIETWFSQESVSDTFMVFLICSLVASICYFTLLWRESNFESDLTGALQCIMLRPPWRTALDWNTFTSFLIYPSYCYRYISCEKFYLAWSRRSVSKRKRQIENERGLGRPDPYLSFSHSSATIALFTFALRFTNWKSGTG